MTDFKLTNVHETHVFFPTNTTKKFKTTYKKENLTEIKTNTT